MVFFGRQRLEPIQKSLAKFFNQDLAATVPVVLAFASLWQPIGFNLNKATFDEPVHGSGGQYKNTF